MTTAQETWLENANAHAHPSVPELSLPDNSSTLFTNQEDDEDYYFMQPQNPQFVSMFDPHGYQSNTELFVSTEETRFTDLVDASFDLANRTFYATCSKLEHQSDPRFRKSTPYSFLENWQLHSMYSKAQQVLLGLADVQPKVLLMGDDFMFTPPMTQQEYGSQMHLDWDEDEDDYEQDSIRWAEKDGVIVMSAPAPDEDGAAEQGGSLVMDENAWMSSRPKRVLQITNPDQDEPPEKNPIDEAFPTPPPLFATKTNGDTMGIHGDSAATSQRDISMSSERINWYRGSQLRRPSTIMESVPEETPGCEDEEPDLPHKEEKGKDIQRAEITCEDGPSQEKTRVHDLLPTGAYQSLADIMPTPDYPVVITIPDHSYGTMDTPNVTDTKKSIPRSLRERIQHRIARTSDTLAETVLTALAMSEALANQKENDENKIIRFVHCVFRIWQVLALGTEAALVHLLSDHPLPTRKPSLARLYSL